MHTRVFIYYFCSNSATLGTGYADRSAALPTVCLLHSNMHKRGKQNFIRETFKENIPISDLPIQKVCLVKMSLESIKKLKRGIYGPQKN